jgi:hypothetical protein
MRWLIWALFGNDDDGIYGDPVWNPLREKKWWIAMLWWVRNPFHNLTFYVLGITNKPFVRYGRYPSDNFAPVSGWNWCVINYKWLWLPFISYVGWLGKFYVGWRERGNFGIKCTGKLLVLLVSLAAYKGYLWIIY